MIHDALAALRRAPPVFYGWICRGHAMAPMISVVDDDTSFRRATARLIHSLGHAVASFGSAEEFLASGRVDETACLVSDVKMPGMTGIELQSRLRQQGCRLPVIFITAHPDANQKSRALASGAVGFLNKPFRDDELISCLDRALSGQS
jgi:FixJ family two-component response regulator